MAERQTRAERARMPIAPHVAKAVAEEHGVCIRPFAVQRTDLETGDTETVDVPCGATLASKCGPCAERKRRLRMAQCREGWHLDEEPDLSEDEPTDDQKWWVEKRADATQWRDDAAASGEDTADLDELLSEVDEEIANSGVRGKLAPEAGQQRRRRSTRRRRDAPDLPRKPVEDRTVGKTFAGNDGKTFRPSIFLTLTLDSYGKVHQDGTPVDPASYDYVRAARDALHFSKLFDRFVQNLRRYLGWDVQYFATIEPQKRLAPHLHMAIRGTVSRADLRRVVAATYHQVWWPQTDQPVYVDRLPVWDVDAQGYVDPTTGEILPTWDEALDELDNLDDADAEPVHVVRFGRQVHAQGVIAGSPDADKCLGYLSKYLTKQVHECHEPVTTDQSAHVDAFVEALRYEPCSPTCANWLRYGVQPKNPRPDMVPGSCKGKAHKREHLGYGGRRVLVSRKWSGKSMADHKHERRAWVLATLGESTTDDSDRYLWHPVDPDDPDLLPLAHRLLRAVAQRTRWRQALDDAKARAAGKPPADVSAIEGVAA